MSQQMQTDLAGKANRAFAAAQDAHEQSVQRAREAGQFLIQAKGDLERGQWLGWLAEHWHYSERQAQGCMRIAAHWDELPTNPQASAYLSVDAVLKQLAKPKAAQHAGGERRAVERDTRTAEPDDVAQMRAERDEARENAAQIASRLDAVEIANAGADRAAKEIISLQHQIEALKAELAQAYEDKARLAAQVKYWKKQAQAKA